MIPSPNTVALVEDDTTLREALGELIASTEDWKLAGAFPDAESALEAIPTNPPQMVLMDIQLPAMSGIECVARLRELCPETLILMVTVYDTNDRIFEALAAGASGYLLKHEAPTKLLDSLHELLTGGSPMSGAIARKVVQHFQKSDSPKDTNLNLTPRETEILALLSKGRLYKEISSDCGIGLDTVRTHLRNIYKKLQVRTRTEAVVKYLGNK
ncbi:MAG: response regulator transcription factor [Akkermansiaceae bacterium]